MQVTIVARLAKWLAEHVRSKHIDLAVFQTDGDLALGKKWNPWFREITQDADNAMIWAAIERARKR